MGAPRERARRAGAVGAVLVALALLLASCGGASSEQSNAGQADQEPSPSAADDGHGHAAKASPAAPARPLRAGERRLTLEMPAAYTPSPPTDAASDDYRCFLLDPGLDTDMTVTGTDVVPGNSRLVHHVILFRVPPDQVDDAEELDEAQEGQGWTCFGDAGIGDQGLDALNDAPWLGAWAPGGRESLVRKGYGVPLEKGSRIVMQVHYSLLAGNGDDVSAARLRVASAKAGLKPVSTMLLPAPVELPCRPQHNDNPLCERQAARYDLASRVGGAATSDALHLLCGTTIRPSAVTRCDRFIERPLTVLGVAGHMHLLGKRISIEVNPETPRARTILDIPVWNFDDQGAKPVRGVRLERGDQVRVTCRHSQKIRDQIPAFEGEPDRYVVWGEGTVDEMCLGILQVAPS